jgi:hypothetical protein
MPGSSFLPLHPSGDVLLPGEGGAGPPSRHEARVRERLSLPAACPPTLQAATWPACWSSSCRPSAMTRGWPRTSTVRPRLRPCGCLCLWVGMRRSRSRACMPAGARSWVYPQADSVH